jgi:four helix bundle protein
MSSIKAFEDLKAWQQARQLTKIIYILTNKPIFNRDYGLKDQIRRAAVSVSSNIAEGFERGGKEELIHFLYIAKGSCGEVRTQLYLSYDLGYISEEEFGKVKEKCKFVSSLIYYLIESIKVSKYKGLKFKKEDKERKEFDEYIARIVNKAHKNKPLNP